MEDKDKVGINRIRNIITVIMELWCNRCHRVVKTQLYGGYRAVETQLYRGHHRGARTRLNGKWRMKMVLEPVSWRIRSIIVREHKY